MAFCRRLITLCGSTHSQQGDCGSTHFLQGGREKVLILHIIILIACVQASLYISFLHNSRNMNTSISLMVYPGLNCLIYFCSGLVKQDCKLGCRELALCD